MVLARGNLRPTQWTRGNVLDNAPAVIQSRSENKRKPLSYSVQRRNVNVVDFLKGDNPIPLLLGFLVLFGPAFTILGHCRRFYYLSGSYIISSCFASRFAALLMIP